MLKLSFKFLILLLVIFIAWRLWATGSISTLSFLKNDVSKEQLQQSQHRYPENSHILAHLAKSEVLDGNNKTAEQHALNSLKKNLTNGMAMALLVEINDHLGQSGKADQAATFTSLLWHTDSFAIARTADHWAKTGQVSKVLSDWNIVLTQHPEAKEKVFPYLVKLAKSDETREMFLPYLKNPPDWWKIFFQYLAEQKHDLNLLSYFYNKRLLSKSPIHPLERKWFLHRLMQAKRWDKAYYTWLSGLTESQLAEVRLVFDGGFEKNPVNNNFAWQFKPSKYIQIKRDSLYGMTGNHVLHLSFHSAEPVEFSGVWQQVILSPGEYQLKMRTQTSLKRSGGLKWVVHCKDNPLQILGETEKIGDHPYWKNISTEFTVPNLDTKCSSQIIRLKSVAITGQSTIILGDFWFDDLEITPLQSENQ